MKGLIMMVGLLAGTAGFAQQTPLKKPSDSLKNQDNMPVLPSQGGQSAMPVLKEKGDALPMPNSYTPMSRSEEHTKALDALQDQLNRFRADSTNRRNQRTPPTGPKKGER